MKKKFIVIILGTILVSGGASYFIDLRDREIALGKATGSQNAQVVTGTRIGTQTKATRQPVSPDMCDYEKNLIWTVINARNSVALINADTGEVLGEYRTGPDNAPRNPSRIVVDAVGNVWIGNRSEGLAGNHGGIVKIGITLGGERVDSSGNPDLNGEYLKGPYLYSTAIDRNNDGLIKTSRGLNDIYAWNDFNGADRAIPSDPVPPQYVQNADDENILVYSRVIPPSVRSLVLSLNQELYIGGYPNFPTAWAKINSQDGSYQTSDTLFSSAQNNFQLGGYNAVINSSGEIFTLDFLDFSIVKLNTNPTLSWNSFASLPTSPAGIVLDSNENIWVTGGSLLLKLDSNLNILQTIDLLPNASQVLFMTITNDDNLWVAGWSPNNVLRLDHQGNPLGQIALPSAPRGLIADTAGKVWVIYNVSEGTRASRINPNTNSIDLDVTLGSSTDFHIGNSAFKVIYQAPCP